MEIAPGLHRIGSDIVACYLVVTSSGVTVVDAGLPAHWRALQAELRALGRTTGDIRGLVLTHGDSDHLGFAERLRQETGAPVFVHAADARRAMTGEKPRTPWGSMRIGPTLRFLGYGLREGMARTRYPREVVALPDPAVSKLPGAPEVVELPGHSPGSVGVLFRGLRAVCVGDALTTRHVLTGVRRGQPAPFTDDPAAADGSLGRLATLDVDWVLPGHGAPWHGSADALVAEVRSAPPAA